MTDPTREKMVTALRDALAQGPMRERAMDALEDDLLYEAKRITDILLAKGVPLPEPPAPAAPPRPKSTWEPSEKAAAMLMEWWIADERYARNECRPLLRRLYAQLHRDRVAALPSPAWDDPDPGFATVRARSGESVSIQRRHLLALADDGTGT